MVELVHTISCRIANYLEKVGLVERDIENSFLNLPIDDEDSLLQLQGASVSYRIAMGPQQGQKVFTLQTLPASTEDEYGQLANTSGFSLHAGVFANADEPGKLETLCRYISRPAIIHKILSYLDKQGSPITANNTRAPPVVALEQTPMCDDFIIQRDFDFGA